MTCEFVKTGHAPSEKTERIRMTAEDRYNHDPVFHRLVDQIFVAIREKQYTASEVREAAMYAAIRYEQMHLRRYGALPTQDLSPGALEDLEACQLEKEDILR